MEYAEGEQEREYGENEGEGDEGGERLIIYGEKMNILYIHTHTYIYTHYI